MTEAPIVVGSDAPDFDLTSTEDVLLMLRDEVPRTALILYVFVAIDDTTRADLQTLAGRVPGWIESGIRVMAMAPVKVADLKQLQAELELPFPLLEDDRDFCARYGVAASAAGSEADPDSDDASESGPVNQPVGSDAGVERRLVLIDRHCKIGWYSDQWSGLQPALEDLKKSRAGKQAPLINYPGQVVNKLVSWWVN